MFISKKKLKNIQDRIKTIENNINGNGYTWNPGIKQDITNLFKILNGINDKFSQLYDFLDIELREEPKKVYLAKKVKKVQTKI